MTSTAAAKRGSRRSEVTRYQMYIDGEFVDAAAGERFDVYDPATEGVIATCPAGGAADVDRAVLAATRAFYDGWRSVSAQERGRILFRPLWLPTWPGRKEGSQPTVSTESPRLPDSLRTCLASLH
jgi:hypothetical protein